MLTITRTKSFAQTAEFTFTARELTEKFTDDQLREVGLFRDLRDADIARRDELDRLEASARCSCEDDECECECHNVRSKDAKHPPVNSGSEHVFWSCVRAFAARGDLANVAHELESRAWSHGGLILDFNRAFAPKA